MFDGCDISRIWKRVPGESASGPKTIEAVEPSTDLGMLCHRFT
jgi:hypothetical protein